MTQTCKDMQTWCSLVRSPRLVELHEQSLATAPRHLYRLFGLRPLSRSLVVSVRRRLISQTTDSALGIMPRTEQRPSSHQGPSLQKLVSRPRMPRHSSYETSASSSSADTISRPTYKRHATYNDSIRPDQRFAESREYASEEEPALAPVDMPMQVTEGVVAAAIRLDARMRELEDVADLFEDFKSSCSSRLFPTADPCRRVYG